MALKWHPDKNPLHHSAACRDKFQKVLNAYQTLKDPLKRQNYDKESNSNKRRREDEEGKNTMPKFRRQQNQYFSENHINSNYKNIEKNYAKICTNYGNVSENRGDIQTNYGNITVNYNHMETNYGNISENYGDIKTNYGNISTNYATVNTNYGWVP